MDVTFYDDINIHKTKPFVYILRVKYFKIHFVYFENTEIVSKRKVAVNSLNAMKENISRKAAHFCEILRQCNK